MGFQGRIRIRKKGVDRTGAATPLAGSILFLFPCLDTITLYMYCILYSISVQYLFICGKGRQTFVIIEKKKKKITGVTTWLSAHFINKHKTKKILYLNTEQNKREIAQTSTVVQSTVLITSQN